MNKQLVRHFVIFCLFIFSIVSDVIAHETNDPLKNFKDDAFLKDDSLEDDFEKKMDSMFETVKKAQDSVANTRMGPLDRYILGRSLAARVITAYKLVDHKDDRLKYLNAVARNIIMASRRGANYIEPVILLLDEPKIINAFAAPGGFIFITTGMLNFLRNEDELAFVLAHEVAHIELDHGLNAIKQNEGAKIFTEATTDESIEGLFSEFRKFAENGYSQELEAEADIRGTQIISSLGYDYNQGIEVIRRLEETTSQTHGIGYPKNRPGRLKSGAGGTTVNKETVTLRQQRYAKMLK